MYDPRDFAANPGKYQLFKTATVARSIFTHNAEHDIPEGTIVGLRYICTARNQLFRRDEPVYALTRNGSEDVTVYGNTLTGFTL